MATAKFTTVVNRDQDDILTEAIWDDQIRDNINQLIGLRSRNLLTNGGFEVWQRGNGPFTRPTATFAADRWQLSSSASLLSVTRETTTTDSSPTALKAVAQSGERVEQFLERGELRGKTISFSIRARQGVANSLKPYICPDNDVTRVYGAQVATTGAWVTLTVTATVSASPAAVGVGVEFAANDTVYLDNAMLVMGPAPAEYVPLHPQEELARCQRYYEVHGGLSSINMAVTGIATAAGQNFSNWIQFAVPKGGIPTLTKNGTWGVTNSGQPSAVNANTHGYQLQGTSSAAGACNFFGNSADDTITAEWNFS